MMEKAGYIFWGVLGIGLIVQGTLWQQFDFVDKEMWVNQTMFVAQRDARALDPKGAYGYPGMPPIDVAIAAKWLWPISFTTALLGALALASAITIAAIGAICYRLRPSSLWWLAVSGLLLCNRLFTLANPPSALVSPLILLLVLISLVLYERKPDITWRFLGLWGVTAGLAAATRLDISIVTILFLIILLFPHLGWRKIGMLIIAGALTFVIVDPFMWYMPKQHIWDIITKIQYHYTAFAAYKLSFVDVLLISPFATLGVGLAIILALFPTHFFEPLPRRFLIGLLIFTLVVSLILLQSRLQVARYFFPLAFIWEALLPLFVLDGIERLHFSFLPLARQSLARRIFQWGVVLALITGQSIMLVHLYFLPVSIFVCPKQANQAFFCSEPTR